MKKEFLFFILFFISTNLSQAANIKEFPQLEIKTLDGKNFDLKEKNGKVVIVNFWAKWCVDCRKELLILDELQKKYQSLGLEIIGISIDRKKYRDEVSKIISSSSFPHAMISEAQKNDFDFPDVVPVCYVIDKNGKLRATMIPDEKLFSVEDFEKEIKPLF